MDQQTTNQTPALQAAAIAPAGDGGQAPAPAAEQTQPQPSAREAKVLTIPSAAMAEIKRGERERGKKQARQELEAEAKSLGFRSHEEMRQAALAARSSKGKGGKQIQQPTRLQPQGGGKAPAKATVPSEPAPAGAAPGQGGSRYLKRLERSNAELLEQKRRLNRSVAQADKRRKDAERELLARDAENALKLEAVRAGVQDPDYAVELLRRSMAGKSAEELRSFDEGRFFATDLRKTHPYLYGVVSVPATTGNGGASAAPPAAPAPGAAAKDQAAPPGARDARKMSREEYQATLRRYGISDPAVGAQLG